MNSKKYVLAMAGIVLVGATTFGVLSAMGQNESETDSTCVVGTVDCNDADLGGDRMGDEAIDAIEQAAHGLLGRYERDLPPDVRIGRRGTEAMMLTDDFVVGRLTVALDDTDGSGYRVVAVTAELPNGPATYELTPG
jgi:hypothetical protein